MQWFEYISLGFTLSDGQTCKAGSYEFTESHTFEPSKKITKIECHIDKYDQFIIRIDFYHHQQRLVEVGMSPGQFFHFHGGGSYVFKIAEDEQLIGCEIDFNENELLGVTWLKWKIRF